VLSVRFLPSGPVWPRSALVLCLAIGRRIDSEGLVKQSAHFFMLSKIARSLRQHRELILNYFRAEKLLSSGVVEGLNNKAKVTMRKSYGFRTFRTLELALYHSLGKLSEPESTHEFF
jgi:hypothetical protein